ncbi:HK97-gp10 family putative phage morphogenesis protein [Alicyclobacillus sp. ALC3]|uniref:HK97-gp10 family putative phage morphogenesis protein n=1 Tax=Alicyclobacillus sp. ALC3 TaxID=2796143 RepID=UPI002379F40C|nr:HK97-gp10 family putative phage morphogenesis protein [Alicyclobacillus sp. ALC3]WDL98127.1 HK97 gp10 family phage protein [Alicyclobacillus sp. ALC3]
MASDVFAVDGYDAIIAKLAKYEDSFKNEIARNALLEGAVPIQEEIAAAVPISTRNEEHIHNDIQIGEPELVNGDWQVSIGPGKKTSWRAGFLEYGHATVNGGHVPAHPFMQPGMKRSKQKFMQTVAGVIQKGLSL